MFKITTNHRTERATIEQDGYALYNDTYKRTLPTYKVSMDIGKLAGILPDAVLIMQDVELSYRANCDVNFHAAMDELVLKKDKSLHFIHKLSKVE